MQAIAMDSTHTAAATVDNSSLQLQIATLRESLRNQRNRARQMWDACAPSVEEEAGETRVALGRFTEKLLRGQMDEAYG